MVFEGFFLLAQFLPIAHFDFKTYYDYEKIYFTHNLIVDDNKFC